MRPNLDLSGWSPLIVIALLSACGTVLSNGSWSCFLMAPLVGTAAGQLAGTVIWPPDSEAGGVAIIFWTALVAAVCFIVGLAVRKVSIVDVKIRRFVWMALGLCVLIGPITAGLTPPLVGRRVARNDQLAAHRFASLKDAAERAGPSRICDGRTLKQNYSGPAFSEMDWEVH